MDKNRINTSASETNELTVSEFLKERKLKKLQENNPYLSLEDNQLSVALGTAYENIVKIQHEGLKPYTQSQFLFDFQQLIFAAQQRYPDIPAAPLGSYFKDKDFAEVESKLLPLLKESCKDSRSLSAEVERYYSWRDNKSFTEGGIREEPFYNSQRYGRQRTSGGLHSADTLKSPLKAGQSTLTEKQIQQLKVRMAQQKIY